jgi:deazaflavin-dependent oxidoreductase (nitroreductase family)
MATRLGAGKRLLYRLPIPLYRAGLGRVLSRRFLCLEHRGRVTGLVRRTVLEVIAYDYQGPVVPVAFGPGSDWYKNLRANPSARITWGGTASQITAQILDGVEASRVLVRYAEDHRWAVRGLDRIVDVGLVADPAAAAQKLPLVRLMVMPSN